MKAGSAEFAALVALTHPDVRVRTEQADTLVRSESFDWQLFLKLVSWHRLTPHIFDALAPVSAELPEAIWRRLKRSCMRCNKSSMGQVGWLVRLSRELNNRDISFIAMKGAVLSRQLHGEPLGRQSKDVDIMVDVGDMDDVERLLVETFHFERQLPASDATPRQFAVAEQYGKDREYRHSSDKTMVEVHWKFAVFDHPLNLSMHEILKHTEHVELNGESIPALAGEFLWLYQTMHGSLSGWYRMSWVRDIAAMLETAPPDWESLLQSARHYRCERMLVEGVAVACSVYDLSLPPPVGTLLHSSRRQRKHLGKIIANLQSCAQPGLMLQLQRSFFLLPFHLFVQQLFRHLLINPNDFKRLHLPDSLFFLYYLSRPLMIVLRRLLSSR